MYRFIKAILFGAISSSLLLLLHWIAGDILEWRIYLMFAMFYACGNLSPR